MELTTMKDAFDRVVKKQKVWTSKSQEVVNQVGCEIEQALANIHTPNDPSSPVDQKSVLAELTTKLNEIGPHKQLETSQKDLNMNLGKYLKILEKSLNPDISKAYRNVEFDPHSMNHIIVSHLYREAMFDVADCLINEAEEHEAVSLKFKFVEMHQILEALRARNLEPALNWVSINREELKHIDLNLEMKLHRLKFMEILLNKDQTDPLKIQIDALSYARTHLISFSSHYMDEIQKLMGCLLWVGKLDISPYSDLISPSHWENLAEEMSRQFCNLLGQSCKCPLSVAVAAGAEGLPILLKLANVMAAKRQEFLAMKQLPVSVELGEEFQFHSIFVCPVSRDQGTEENPPMLLPCGHVLCKQSINKLSKSSTRPFKCPYCPFEVSVAHCRQLYF